MIYRCISISNIPLYNYSLITPNNVVQYKKTSLKECDGSEDSLTGEDSDDSDTESAEEDVTEHGPKR